MDYEETKKFILLKNKNIYPVCKIKIDHVLCSCKGNYIGKSKRDMVTRMGEHYNSTLDYEPAEHFNKKHQHSHSWKTLVNTSKYSRTRKNLEAMYY